LSEWIAFYAIEEQDSEPEEEPDPMADAKAVAIAKLTKAREERESSQL